MIWFRRVAATFLAVIAVCFLIGAMVLWRVNDTAGNPQFYADQLRQADVYNFTYDTALPAALSENASSLPDDMSQFTPQIVSLAKQTLPPQWLQTQVELAINAALPYILGDTQSFKVNVPLKDRVQAGVAAAKTMLQDPSVAPKVYDDIVKQIVDQAVSNTSGVPAGFALSRSELDSLVRTVVPQDWLLAQMDNAIDQVAPYLAGDAPHFTVKVNISDRMDALQTAVTDIFKRQQTYDYIYQSVLVPAIRQNIQTSVALPIPGLTLSDAEILQTVKQGLPLDWYQAQVANVIAQTFSYLKGQQPTLNVSIPLSDRRPAITQALTALVTQKLQGLGITPAQVQQLLGVDLNTLLQPMVAGWVPDQVTFTEADLRSGLGNLGGGTDFITQAKGWVQNGITYTDQDLRTSLGINSSNLDDMRTRIASGVSFTQVDLRNAIGNGAQGAQSLQDFDKTRSSLSTLRHWKLLLWIVPLLMLAGIGFLGGRRWSTRLIWGAAPLAVAGFIALIAFGPVFGSTAQPQINDALARATQGKTGLDLLLSQKGVEIARNAVDSFIGGLRVQSAIMLVIGLLLSAGGVVLYVWYDKSKAKKSVQ